MTDVRIRKEGRAGRITLARPDALNAVTWEMCLEIEGALDAWRDDGEVVLVVVDAEGDKAFSAGGDLQSMYREGKDGNAEYAHRFWTDEYRLNAKIFDYPKPYVSFLKGFTMGGGVGVGCHGSNRIVGETSQVAMPECSIGLVPDVGGSFILARAPGRVGEYLAVTGFRMGPADAIYATFADTFVPEDRWPGLIEELCETGDVACLDAAAEKPPSGKLPDREDWISRSFRGATLADVLRGLDRDHSDLSAETRTAILRQSPLSAACAYEMIGRVRGASDIRRALEMEYRFTHRSIQHSDFIEGIRALIIDKDKSPNWRHDSPEHVTPSEVARMLMPLGAERLRLEEATA